MKDGKVLCYMFWFAIWRVDRAQNLAKYDRRLGVCIQLTNRNLAIAHFMHSACVQNKRCAPSWTFQHKSWHLCFLL